MKRIIRATIAVVALHGCQQSQDQFVLVLDSDLNVPDELTHIEIAAYAQGASEGDGTKIDLLQTGLPASLGILPLQDDVPLVIQAQGLDGAGQSVVARRIVIFDKPGGFVRVPMFLARSCSGVVCGAEESCTEMGCEPVRVGSNQMAHVEEGSELSNLCRPGEGSCHSDLSGFQKCIRYGEDIQTVSCGQGDVCDPATIECVQVESTKMHVVEVFKVGGGAGYVSTTDGQIDCGSKCRIEVQHGSSLELNASPDANSTFVTWENDCGGTGPCRLTVDEDTTINARFQPSGVGQQIEVDITGSGAGRVYSDPPGIDCSGGRCTGSFAQNTTVTFHAEPGANSGFAGWFGDCQGLGSCSLRMDAPRWLSANFAYDSGATNVELWVSMVGNGGGRVVSTPSGIDCGTQCNTTFPRDSRVTLSASPDPSSTFIEWQGACTGVGQCVVDMSTNLDVFAVFDNPNIGPSIPHDVNGDGYPDLVFGAPGIETTRGLMVGRVYIAFGPKQNIALGAANADRIFTGADPDARLGASIALGDLDGDGYDDIAIGAPGYQMRGAVYLIFGGPGLVGSSLITNVGAPVLVGEVFGDAFGTSVLIEDVNQDGYAELIVGAPADAAASFGKVYILPGGPGFSPTALTGAIRWQGVEAGDGFGSTLAAIGDVDLDGWPDLAIGAPKWSPNFDDRGQVSLYLGRGNPSTSMGAPAPDVRINGPQMNDVFGWSIAGLADFNADGIDDFALGSPYNDRVHVVYGRTSWQTAPQRGDLILNGLGWFGASIAGGHDVTGDGYPDLVVGAPNQRGQEGDVRVFRGGSNPAQDAAFVINGSCAPNNQCEHEYFGRSVMIGHDVDNDGFPEVIAGSRFGGGNAGSLERGRIGTFPLWPATTSPTLPSGAASLQIVGEDMNNGWCGTLPGAPFYW